MSFKRFLFRFFIIFFLVFLFCMVGFLLFKPIYISSSILIPYSLHPYDICLTYPIVWKQIKCFFAFFYFLSSMICSHWIFSLFVSHLPHHRKKKLKTVSKNITTNLQNSSKLSLLVGKNENDTLIFIPEKSLYQNILITGTIGSGKTSSCMYPFTRQLIRHGIPSSSQKLGMLILDVKGNFYQKVLEFAKSCDRLEDVFVLELGGSITYNPLDKPDLKPAVLANRLKTILTLFSPNTSDSFWLDKVEEFLTESIKFCRLYNKGYVTFVELHKLVSLPNYYLDKLDIIKEDFLAGKLSRKDCYNVLSSIEFFEKEFYQLDDRTLSIIRSEVTRITNCFVSDYDIRSTFCPDKKDITFTGFKQVVEQGKIVVLNMNIYEYRNLSKIIATYLKLDFQTEVMSRLSHTNSNLRSVAFVCDEFHEYCTATDADFFSQSREAKCINIVATQSYSSLLHTLNNPYTVKVIVQNLINKLWFRTDDMATIEDIQKQIGKEEKEKVSKTISENAKETSYSYLTNSFYSKDSNLSESLNQYTQSDYIYDTNFFTQNLETFSCLAFLSTGYQILPPIKLKLLPYFTQKSNTILKGGYLS